MVTQNLLERLVANDMPLAKVHAEELRDQIENALEGCGKRELYDVAIVRENNGYRVHTKRNKTKVQKADAQQKAEAQKADSKSKSTQKIVRFRKVI